MVGDLKIWRVYNIFTNNIIMICMPYLGWNLTFKYSENIFEFKDMHMM
jgi:hypothetical protein